MPGKGGAANVRQRAMQVDTGAGMGLTGRKYNADDADGILVEPLTVVYFALGFMFIVLALHLLGRFLGFTGV